MFGVGKKSVPDDSVYVLCLSLDAGNETTGQQKESAQAVQSFHLRLPLSKGYKVVPLNSMCLNFLQKRSQKNENNTEWTA